jgi:hypothetical protein
MIDLLGRIAFILPAAAAGILTTEGHVGALIVTSLACYGIYWLVIAYSND